MARPTGLLSGAHIVLYSKSAERDRRFLRDILKLAHVDAGDGWLIFALPPSELAVHPTRGASSHELYLLCRNLNRTLKVLERANVKHSRPRELGWGIIARLSLPSGARVGLYQPKHVLARG